jgi:tRNA-Thr(GGU) m(6)t(6)A37 methyltransferase TsaA
MSRMTFTVRPIGHVRSPLADPAAAPRQPDEGAPPATLVIDDAYLAGLDGVAVGADLLVLTWLHQGSRDVLSTRPRNDPTRPEQGVFSTRSPDRPNPIGLHRVRVVAVDGGAVGVDALEAVDGTPVLDLKPVLGDVAER